MNKYEKEKAFNEKVRKVMKETGWDKLDREELMQAVSKQLDELVKLGQVERLIGEDGNFYYRSNKTDKGES